MIVRGETSRRLELSISKNTPHGRWGQGPGSVDPRFPAGLPFHVPLIVLALLSCFFASCNSGQAVPMQMFVAVSRGDVQDSYRKPNTGMWSLMASSRCNGGLASNLGNISERVLRGNRIGANRTESL